MRISRENITDVLYECIEELNEQLSKEEKLRKSPETRLFGHGGGLDSLSWVNLIALVEEKCQERFGKTLVLTDGTDEPSARDPLESVGTLAEYIELALNQGLDTWR